MGSMLALQDGATTKGLMPFHFAGREVRVITGEDGDPLFVGRDVCDVLSYANANDAMNRHCRGIVKRYPLQTAGGLQELRVLTEADVLRLIVNCTLPAAQAFERMVFEEILPTIRRTGSYSVADPLANLPAEQRALVGLMLDAAAMKKVQAEQGAAIARIEQRVEETAQAQLMLTRPANAESIMHIRERINKLYGLPPRIIDTVLRQSLYAPKPAGMVKNTREEAKGASYAVYWTKDISALFARFVSECQRVTETLVTHPLIIGRFKLVTQEVSHA